MGEIAKISNESMREILQIVWCILKSWRGGAGADMQESKLPPNQGKKKKKNLPNLGFNITENIMTSETKSILLIKCLLLTEQLHSYRLLN